MLERHQNTVALDRLHTRHAGILTPPPRLNAQQWADQYRYLSSESSALPGKYRSSFAPYQREWMECATDPTVQSVDLMVAAQLGKTEVLLNVLGFFIAADPAPVLMVQPTIDLAKAFSKERIAPMLRDTPALKGKVRDARSRDSENTVLLKSFTGGNLALAGANAPSGLASRPRRVVLQDEIDRFPGSAGTEGDPCALAERRTETFWNAVNYRSGTPTLRGLSRIEANFLLTDQRRWFCPCPRCGHSQTLKWSQVQWPKIKKTSSETSSETLSHVPEEAYYVCEGCEARLSDDERLLMVRAGEWRATAPMGSGTLPHGRRGYHLNGIACCFKAKRGYKNRLHQMASEYLAAYAKGQLTLRVWQNTFLAETFEEETESIALAPLLERAEKYGPESLPEQVVLVAAAVDVQKDRLEVEVVGLGEDDETWGVQFRKLFGDTEQPEVWEDLSEYLCTTFRRSDGVDLRITATAIDLRHNPKQVRTWVKSCGIPRVYAVYGVGGDQPLLVTPRWNKHYLFRSWAVCDKAGKDILFARLRVAEPGPRFCHFPKGQGYTEDYFQQLTSEVLKTTYRHGFPVQTYEKKPGARNEALDIRKYWIACMEILKPNITTIAKRIHPGSPPPAPPGENGDPGPGPGPGPNPTGPKPSPGSPSRQKVRIGDGYSKPGGWKIK